MELDKKLYTEINEFCKLNGLKTRDFIHKILKEAFLREKYGDSPFIKVQMTKTAEEEALKKINELIESQVSLPPEIMEAVDEHFFEMLGEENTPEPQNPKPIEIVSSVEPVIDEPIRSKETPIEGVIIKEAPKPKKKRKLN